MDRYAASHCNHLGHVLKSDMLKLLMQYVAPGDVLALWVALGAGKRFMENDQNELNSIVQPYLPRSFAKIMLDWQRERIQRDHGRILALDDFDESLTFASGLDVLCPERDKRLYQKFVHMCSCSPRTCYDLFHNLLMKDVNVSPVMFFGSASMLHVIKEETSQMLQDFIMRGMERSFNRSQARLFLLLLAILMQQEIEIQILLSLDIMSLFYPSW